MPIEFACESCAKLLRVPDGTAGQSCQCPACQVILEIPDPRAIEIVEVVEDSGAQQRLNIPCPKCHFELEVDPQLLGTKGQCRNCKYIFLISTNPDEAGTAAEAQVSGLVFSCPKCNQLFEGQPEMEGRKGKCHTCGEVFAIHLEEVKEPETQIIRRPAALQSQQPTEQERPQPAAASPIQLACPACNGVMEVPGSAAGQTTACPYCSQLLLIPEPSALPSPAPISSASQGGSALPVHPEFERPANIKTKARNQPKKPAVGHSFPISQSKPVKQTQTPAGTPREEAWADLGDMSGAAQSNPYATTSSGFESASAGAWEAPTTRRRRLTFSNAFNLAFERAFPECLTAIVIYILIGIATSVIGYGGLFLLGFFLRSLGVGQDIGFVIVTIALVGIGLFTVAAATTGLCMVCNGALVTIRKKHADSDALFSTGGFFVPMLLFLFVAFLVGAILGGIPQAVAYLVGPQNGILIALAALCMLPLSVAFSVGTCLAPIAIVDGDGPIDAIATSFKIFFAHPLTMIAILIVTGIGFLFISVFTCGLGALVLAGFPYYVLAACYHLAIR